MLLRRDALRAPADQAFRWIEKCLKRVQNDSPPPFHEFFDEVGEPLLVRRTPATPMATYAAHGRCKCAASNLCSLHRCNCPMCQKADRPTLKCKWRLHIKTYEARKVKAKSDYLRLWRGVKKDDTLKRLRTTLTWQRSGASTCATWPARESMLCSGVCPSTRTCTNLRLPWTCRSPCTVRAFERTAWCRLWGLDAAAS